MAEAEAPGSREVAVTLLDFRDRKDFAGASRRLHEALLGATLLVPLTAFAESGEERALKLVAVPGPEEEPRLLAFTTESTFQFGGQAPPFALAFAPQLCDFAIRNGVSQVSIDSGGPVSATLERWELRALARGERPDANRSLLSMSPVAREQAPPGLLGALADDFGRQPVFLMEERDGRRRHLILGCVSPPPASPEELRERLRPHIAPNDRLSVLRLSPAEAEQLGDAGLRPLAS